MAFVPGCKHDLFLSYVHEESVWVDEFRRALSEAFANRTGEHITFWQDVRNLRAGEKWDTRIQQAIRNAAVFLAIVSPRYLNSPHCKREYEFLLKDGIEALEIDGFHRFVKIIKNPDENNYWELLLEGLQDLRFFPEGGEYEYPPDSHDFKVAILKCCKQLLEILRHMCNSRRTLYVAPAGVELKTEWETLVYELKDQGYGINRGALLGLGFDEATIQKAMNHATDVIFLFARELDESSRAQFRVARSLKKPVSCWVRPGVDREKAVEQIHTAADCPEGLEILGGNSIREFVPQLVEKLERDQARTKVPETDSGGKLLYLNFDGSMAEDCRSAATVGKIAEARSFKVLRSGRDGAHQDLMTKAGAVLLFRPTRREPDKWLRVHAMELAHAGQIFERPNLTRALLVNDPSRVEPFAPGVPAYAWSEPFSAETLAPFFEIAAERSANGNAAH